MNIWTTEGGEQSFWLARCVSQRWSPSIGDPDLLGWITVLAYILAAGFAGWAVVALRGKERVFWLGIFVLLSLLALNKQLDLHSALTATGRCIAQFQGWYDQRREVQLLFVALLMLGCLGVLLLLSWWMWGNLRHNELALIGLGILAVFVLIRAAGFHHVGNPIENGVHAKQASSILELLGIALIGLNAVKRRSLASRS